MKFSQEIKEAARKATKPATMGIIGNATLYRLCRKYPLHNDPDAIGAKIWLIGRSYAAAIERRRKYLKEPNDDFYQRRVIPGMRRSGIDRMFKKLRNEKKITKENILLILSVHRQLQKTFKEISGLEKRSLASKYLHFHFPNLFFIYDSRASNALTKISKLPGEFKDIIKNKSVDQKYADFFCCAFITRSEIESVIGKKMSPRDFDSMLILLENEALRKRASKTDQH